MSEATVRASIITILNGVSNIGNVYNREPLTTNWDTFLDKFKATVSSVDMIRGWTVSCISATPTGLVAGGARDSEYYYTYTYKIRGYNSLNFDNTTETDFLALCFTTMAALNAGIVSGNIFNAGLADLDPFEPRMFSGVLCHYAEITQVVMETVT